MTTSATNKKTMESYTLYFPFRLAPSHDIKELDEPYITEKSGLSLKIRKEGDIYSLTIGEFPSKKAGKLFIRKLWPSLMWAMLHQGLSPEASLSFQEIRYYDDPFQAAENISKSLGQKIKKVDGGICGDRPAIYPTGKIVCGVIANAPSLSLSFSPDKTVDYIVEALAMPSLEHVSEDPKLKLAIDLYNSFFRESTANAQFLTLINGLGSSRTS